MSQRDERIDSYVAAAAPFAQPILRHLREVMHRAVPDVEETIKWGMPHFCVGGVNVAGMAAFKAHASFGIWRGQELGLGKAGEQGGMGSFGRIASLADLPDDAVLLDLMASAAALAKAGRPKRVRAAPRPPLATPDDLAAALAAQPAAQTVWDGFPPSHRREYIEWITEAKQAATRERRLHQTVEWIAEGKDRNWKYRRL